MFEYKGNILAVVNQKGGVGKTTVASIIAEYAAIHEKLNVAVVDLDMQCNSTDYWVGMDQAPQATGGQLPPRHPDFNGDPDLEERSSIADIFFGKSVLPHPTFISVDNGFDACVEVIVGHPALLESINTEFDNSSGKIATRIINRLGEFLHMQEVVDTYDLIILDTGPSRNPIFRAAIRAATHVVIPFEPEEKSLQGINAMLQVIQSENFSRTEETQLQIVGLCPNKVRSNTNIHKSTLEMLHDKLGEYIFPEGVFLPMSAAFPERDLKGITPRSIFQISNAHKANIQSVCVGSYVLSHIFPTIKAVAPT